MPSKEDRIYRIATITFAIVMVIMVAFTIASASPKSASNGWQSSAEPNGSTYSAENDNVHNHYCHGGLLMEGEACN